MARIDVDDAVKVLPIVAGGSGRHVAGRRLVVCGVETIVRAICRAWSSSASNRRRPDLVHVGAAKLPL
jgi:hypothetical protein